MIKRVEREAEFEEISPYNPAHTNYGNCCGIFNRIDKDGILCCNECGMTINELLDEIEQKNVTD